MDILDVIAHDVRSVPNRQRYHVFFKDTVLAGKDFGPRIQTLPGTAAVVNAVAHERNGIGYGGAAYAKRVKVLRVRADRTKPAYAPDRDTVLSGTYPLARPLYFYLRVRPSGEIKRFIDFVLSPEGQAIVNDVGYYPVQSGRRS